VTVPPPGAAGGGGEIALHVAADDPCLPGHFPGQPILPGVLLLDALAAALCPAPPAEMVLEAVKFAAPVRPGQVVTLRWRETAPGRAAFEAEADGARVLSGRAIWHAAPADRQP
jgi:3-hydroxymyristoyl/3-hydroxydecanoyl-(acyl carrier protein) dehydratase